MKFKFNTIGLFTVRQPEMVAFYRDVMGFISAYHHALGTAHMLYH